MEEVTIRTSDNFLHVLQIKEDLACRPDSACQRKVRPLRRHSVVDHEYAVLGNKRLRTAFGAFLPGMAGDKMGPRYV
jgi:hypothetical protein